MLSRRTDGNVSSTLRRLGAQVAPSKPIATISAAAIFFATAVPLPAHAWTAGTGTPESGPHCHGGGVVINKWINIYKPVNIWKNITINNDVSIEKNVSINKSISINKGNVEVSAEAFAFASASASAQAATYGGGYVQEITVNKDSGMIGQAQSAESCEIQEATVVKAIHTVCIAPDGREFPASHMMPDTWVESSYEGEVARCIPGASVKIVIGDVVQSDQGMAGTYTHGQTFVCAEHEALRHYKDGMLKCAPAVPVTDCTERTNLRKYGTGDLFVSYRTKVCATPTQEARERAIDLSGMTLEGGVGPGY